MIDSDSETENARKVFSGGLKRKRIEFVPAADPSTTTAPRVAPHLSLGEQYLSITLKNRVSSASKTETVTASAIEASHKTEQKSRLAKGAQCGICKTPVDAGSIEAVATPLRHAASLAHQVCLQHSYPPSHLDRNRHGLKYLSSYGWDPDSQLGLGASGAGIRVPIKVKAKHDTVGLGVKMSGRDPMVEGREAKLDAKGLRRRERGERTRRERLHQMFYANDEVNKYLGFG